MDRFPESSQFQRNSSWSPESSYGETWLRRKLIHEERRQTNETSRRSVTTDDLDEVIGSIDLGLVLDLESPFHDADPTSPESGRLIETFPALDLYYERNLHYSNGTSLTSGPCPISLYSPGEDSKLVEEKLKIWARIVGRSLRQRYTSA